MIIFYILCSLLFSFSDTGTIHLSVQNIQKAKGSINIAVFNSEDSFLNEGLAIQTQSIRVNNKEDITVSLKGLPYGTYAIALYQDVNGNGVLDTNLFGVPKEPYGFSNNAPSKWGPPEYEVARFELNQATFSTSTKVMKWSEQ